MMTRMMLMLKLVLVMTVVKIAVSVSAVFPNDRQQQSSSSSRHESSNNNGGGRMASSGPQRHLQSLSSSTPPSSSYYGRYDHYPPYCAIPQQMDDRKIPPLRDFLPKSGLETDNDDGNSTASKKSLVGETRLVHVTAIIRHGARTPWSSEMKCYDGYWESDQTGKWDCDDLMTFQATPTRNGTSTHSGQNDLPLVLFEKKYDALSFPQEGLSNVLNGTCQMGQLIQQGYYQQIANGKIIRDAYAYVEGEYDHDERMRLLNLKMTQPEGPLPWQHPQQLYFRADDYQRTVMSGQVLIRSLFDPEMQAFQQQNPQADIVIPLHIADEVKDVMDPNANDCPRLNTMAAEAFNSKEYQDFYNSENSKEIREYMATKLKMDDDASILDCFMCTMCTDRPLPESVDDYDGSEDNWFTRLTEYGIQKYTSALKHNGAQFAKLGIGPLWYEIMKNIDKALNEDPDVAKLALFAGHDTTLMPLLASLGPDLWKDTDWAPYASMMLIEIHELIDGRHDPNVYSSKFAFRLLFNGEILTPLIDGCHEDCELCDIVYLKTIVDPIATRDMDCSAPSSGEEAPLSSPLSSTGTTTTTTTKAATEGDFSLLSLSTTTGMALFVGLVLLSGFGGSAITFACLRKRFLRDKNYKNLDRDGAWNTDGDYDDIVNGDISNGGYGLELTEQQEGFDDEIH